jgi:hypothetical protein
MARSIIVSANKTLATSARRRRGCRPRQRLDGELVDQRQDLELSAISDPIHHKVPIPEVILAYGPQS